MARKKPTTAKQKVDQVSKAYAQGMKDGLDAAYRVAVAESSSDRARDNGVAWANCSRHIAEDIAKLYPQEQDNGEGTDQGPEAGEEAPVVESDAEGN